MSESSAEANDSAEEVPKPRRRWGGVVLRGVIGVVAVAGLALGGYVVWTQAVASPSLTAVEQIEARTLELERGQQAAAGTQQALAGRLDSLQANTQANADLLDEVRAALARGLAPTADAAPTPARWRVAEVAYLLRIANHRLAMERDLGAAKALLEGADAVLADLDDFAFFEVRAQIAGELLALEDHEDTDIQGAYLMLEAIKGKLNQLPLRLPEYSSRQEPAAATTGEAGLEAESGGVWASLAAIGDRLSELVRFRRHEGEAVRPLLAPEQAAYLEQHLRLALERAQLALLRRDAVIFAANIADAEAWLSTYVDANHGVTKQLQAALAEASRLNVAAPLPDISGSLRALREVVPALEPSALGESTTEATTAPEGDAS
ncbi:MAG: hypothetical protein F4Y01_03105 [Gammaproteobacteria bacterium]|nr:hypothetical protein [Gammaproteobacteria bacterium]